MNKHCTCSNCTAVRQQRRDRIMNKIVVVFFTLFVMYVTSHVVHFIIEGVK